MKNEQTAVVEEHQAKANEKAAQEELTLEELEGDDGAYSIMPTRS